jgi:hypothetical protein
MPQPLQMPRFTHCCPTGVRGRATRLAATLTNASKAYRAAARKNSRRLSTCWGKMRITKWLKYNAQSFHHHSKSRYFRIANYRPYFALSMAEFGRWALP